MLQDQQVLGGKVFHLPFGRELRQLNPGERERLRDDILKAGRVIVPVIVDTHNNVIDGRNRILIAAALMLPLSAVPVVVIDVDFETAREMCLRLNLNRRHMTSEEQELYREDLKRAAFRLRAEGWTQRAIAEKLGVGKGTVERWLEGFTLAPPGASVNPADAPQPDPVASPPSPPMDSKEERDADILRLRKEGHSIRGVAAELGIGHMTVQNVLKKLESAGVDVTPMKRAPTPRPKPKPADAAEKRINAAVMTTIAVMRKAGVTAEGWPAVSCRVQEGL